jgi:diadenosine tetraphosphate (Ap4A) HIT family hydrolase
MDGVDAGQAIFHYHIHVIPRRKGSVTNPRGGIRNIVPPANKYLATVRSSNVGNRVVNNSDPIWMSMIG